MVFLLLESSDLVNRSRGLRNGRANFAQRGTVGENPESPR